MADHLTPAAARRVFLTVTVTRWFPVGLVVGLMTLWPLDRGLSIAEALLVFSFVGLVTFALELPTSGFADAFGRKPVYLAAGTVQVVAAALLLRADSLAAFIVVGVLTGAFRALDSGPLEAWYVDTVHLTDPGAPVDRTLATQGMLVGGGIAAGSLVSGALVWWHPLPGVSALWLPVAAHLALTVVHLAAIAVLVREPDRRPSWATARASVLDAPRVVAGGLRLVRLDVVLRGLLLVEVFWAVGMVVFETLMPIRLAEMVGGEEQAGVLVGPAAAAGWAAFSAGSALAGVLGSRIGVARTAVLARVLNGTGALVMGLVAGPVALVAAYLVTYGLHGTAGAPHAALLHRQATRDNRATVLSMNSMMGFLGFSLASPSLGVLAEAGSTQVAMVTAGALSVLGAWWYRPARRAELAAAREVQHAG